MTRILIVLCILILLSLACGVPPLPTVTPTVTHLERVPYGAEPVMVTPDAATKQVDGHK